MKKNITNFEFFARLKNNFFEGLLLSLLLHGILGLLLFSFTSIRDFIPAESEEEKIDSSDFFDKKNILIRVDAEDDDVLSDSKLTSTSSKIGQGQIIEGDSQHILGRTHFTGIKDDVEENYQLDVDVAKKSDQLDLQKKWLAEEYFSGLLQRDNKDNESRENNDEIKNIEDLQDQKFAVESEVSFNQQFWFDRNGKLQASVNKTEEAAFFLELAENIAKSFSMYLRANDRVNYYFLKKDYVRFLVKINDDGQVFFVKQIVASQNQEYLNYLSKQIIEDVPKVVEKIPEKITKQNLNNEVHLLIEFRYSGRPLRRWWMGIDFVNI